MSVSTQQLQKFIDSELFPSDPDGRFKYVMGVACYVLFRLKESPTYTNPIVLCSRNYDRLRYIWTAFMVFGERSRIKFGKEALKIDSADYSKSLENYELEGYWWKRFTKGSLYEAIFKPRLREDILELKEFPEAFVGVSNAEYKTIQEQEAFLWRKREEEENEIGRKKRKEKQKKKEEENREQEERKQHLSTRPLQKFLNGGIFPDEGRWYISPAYIKYAMVLACSELAKLKEPPTYKDPIVLRGDDYSHLKYVWMAFMIFGEQSTMKFDSQAIIVESKKLDTSVFLYGYGLKTYPIPTYDHFGKAQPDSNYEWICEFKRYLKDDMLKLTEFPEAFEGISSVEYPTIEEQENARRKQLEEEKLTEEQKKREEEQKKLAEEQRIREERELAVKKRLEEEQEKNARLK